MLHRQLAARVSVLVCFGGYALVAQSTPDLMQFREHTAAVQNRYADRPELNPSPQSILVIQIHKDPHIELWLDSLYGTTNDECRTQTEFAHFIGDPDVSQGVYDSVRLPSGQSDFTVRFFLDRYLPGRCNWQPMGISHSEFLPEDSRHPDSNSVIIAVRQKSPPLTPGPVIVTETKIAWICHREEPRTHAKGLFCHGRPTSLENHANQAMSIDGGFVKIEFALAPD
jgi:hypothetical protein